MKTLAAALTVATLATLGTVGTASATRSLGMYNPSAPDKQFVYTRDRLHPGRAARKSMKPMKPAQ